MNRNKKNFCLTAIALSLSFPVFGQVTTEEQQSIHAFLQRLQKDPRHTMDEIPVKTTIAPYVLKKIPKFNTQAVESGKFIEAKDEVRVKILSATKRARVSGLRSGIMSNDNPANLVDNGNYLVRNVLEMDRLNLSYATLNEQPWSDTYWPLYNGSVSFRYGDPDVYYNSPKTWKDYWTYSNQTRLIPEYINTGNIDLLSPAEKYDLLVNDGNFSLTRAGWGMGEGYYNSTGDVEGWMGLCHGWAPAAYMLPRPKQSIVVKSAAGRDIKFYPSDVKALGTLLWAEAAPNTRFVGGRCNAKDPQKDENGRIIDQDCFDVNPGSWHQSVVNQIGVAKRSFVIDATYDYEVWNQPVMSYSYVYFNPQTGKAFNNAKDAAIALANYTNDKFSRYRSNATVNVVGVKMKLNYISETEPTHADYDSPRQDAVTSVSYLYDLELDAYGNIIGGEWYNNRHPDFLWTPSREQHAVSSYNPTDSWNPRNPLPAYWTNNAINASRNSQPLTSVVEQLFQTAAGQ